MDIKHLSSRSLGQLRCFLQNHLLESVIPFWTKHAVDTDGGLNTCVLDDGSVVSHDKWLYSQWRAVWVFATLYRKVEPRQEWLDIAKNIVEFCERYGWDDQFEGWRLCLSGEGKVLRGCECLHVDGFAMYGLTALAKVSDNERHASLARKTADAVLRHLDRPHDEIALWPFVAPKGSRVHSVPMIFSTCFWELGELLDEDRYRQAAVAMSDEIFEKFYRPDRDVLLELVGADGTELPPPTGTVVNPGHVIESMWFQIHIARDRKDQARIDQAIDLIRRHVELGWDEELGGLFLTVDADQIGRGQIPEGTGTLKVWWPHTEALYALLLAYEHCRQDWCLDWYGKVHGYSFSHFPVAEHGEWRQKLNRGGEPLPLLTNIVGLPVKDPFHLPRAMIYCLDVLSRISS